MGQERNQTQRDDAKTAARMGFIMKMYVFTAVTQVLE